MVSRWPGRYVRRANTIDRRFALSVINRDTSCETIKALTGASFVSDVEVKVIRRNTAQVLQGA